MKGELRTASRSESAISWTIFDASGMISGRKTMISASLIPMTTTMAKKMFKGLEKSTFEAVEVLISLTIVNKISFHLETVFYRAGTTN
jgi:hypothetical protein